MSLWPWPCGESAASYAWLRWVSTRVSTCLGPSQQLSGALLVSHSRLYAATDDPIVQQLNRTFAIALPHYALCCPRERATMRLCAPGSPAVYTWNACRSSYSRHFTHMTRAQRIRVV